VSETSEATLVTPPSRSRWQSIAALALALIAVPVLVAVGAVADEQPVREGEPAPRTVFADTQVRVLDQEATETARRQAAESVEPVTASDREAQAAIVRDVREVFRPPVTCGSRGRRDAHPVHAAPRAGLAGRRARRGLADALVGLSDGELDVVERETVSIAQQLARQRVTADDLELVLEDTIRDELAVRSLPGDADERITEPLLEQVMRPTVVVDPDATSAARERAAEEADEVVEIWRPGEAIVRAGEVVGSMQMQAIGQLGLEGSSPLRALLRAGLAMVLVTGVAVVYLSADAAARLGAQRQAPAAVDPDLRLRPAGRRLQRPDRRHLLGLDLRRARRCAGHARRAAGPPRRRHRDHAARVGAGAARRADLGPVALFAAAAVLVSVPLTTGIGSRSDLRSATLRAGLSYPLIAVAVVAVFGPREELLTVLGAGAVNGCSPRWRSRGACRSSRTSSGCPPSRRCSTSPTATTRCCGSSRPRRSAPTTTP
jgi:cyclic-di-AMP phosphodiesterase PgpH